MCSQQPFKINRAQMLRDDRTILPLKHTSDAKLIEISSNCQWSNDERSPMGLELIWGHGQPAWGSPAKRPTLTAGSAADRP